MILGNRRISLDQDRMFLAKFNGFPLLTERGKFNLIQVLELKKKILLVVFHSFLTNAQDD